MKRLITPIFILFSCVTGFSQEWMKVHFNDDRSFSFFDNWPRQEWTIPIRTDAIKNVEVAEQLLQFQLADSLALSPLEIVTDDIDSISFACSLSDEEKGHNKYRPFALHIFLCGAEKYEINKEEWTDCFIALDGMGEYADFSGKAQIKGRGNSSWSWYDKKPYKIKLGEKSKLLGLEKAKNWNLLANYRDVTDMMNVFAFECARYMGMPHTNHSRFVEIFINGEFNGLYQLTEKIEVGKNRINIDEEEGVLLCFDQDDGPNLSPNAADNFWSEVYSLPMCVKHPDTPSPEKLQEAKDDFARLEKAVKAHDFALVDSLMDINSFISILQLHEFLYNVEIDAPRSLYMYKDKGGKYTFGPVWDWDAGYDFDWSDMYTGHRFFMDYKELVMGTEPATAKGAAYRISGFWRDMFNDSTFVRRYKEAWLAVSDSIYEKPWSITQKFVDELNKGAYSRETQTWGVISGADTRTAARAYLMTPEYELDRMKVWLKNRKAYIDEVIKGYPEPEPEEEVNPTEGFTLVKTFNNEVTCYADWGYSQWGTIDTDEDEIKSLLGGKPTSLVPLNANGEEGRNTAAGTYGAWFDDEGNTTNWGNNSHMYIESDDMYSWAFGIHPEICREGHTHSATMQFRRGKKAVNVKVNFNIE